MSPPEIFDPCTLSREEFVSGPDADEEPVVDEIFAKTLDDILKDHFGSGAKAVETPSDAVITVSLLNNGFAFVGFDEGVLMMREGEAVGAYLGYDLALADAWRGQGFGTELVLERAMRSGGVPQWEAEKAGYSRAGLRAHEVAWEMAEDRELFARKAARLILAEFRANDVAEDDARMRLGVPVLWTAEDWLVQEIRGRGVDTVLASIAGKPAPSA